MVNQNRSLSGRRYLFAAVLTLLIFSLGVMLGMVIEGKRVAVINEKANEQRLDFNSIQLQYEYINQLSLEKNCDALAKSFDNNVNTLEDTREKLESYHGQASVNKAEFDLIRREYTIAQFNYWLFAKKYKKLCNADIATILFFYDDEDKCNRCSDQGYILSYLKKTFGDRLLNFAIYGRYEDEPMVGIIKTAYGINEYPTLVIEDVAFDGFMAVDDVKEQVCLVINNTHEAC